MQLPHPYNVPLGGLGSFLYSPPIALLFNLFGALPWWVFLWLWLAAMVGTVIWLGGRWTLALLAFPPVALELYHGNIHLFLAAAIALGFAYPWTWSFILLTKATSGVGLLWFVVRREWRQLAIAVGVTAAIAAVSFVIAPALWSEWIRFVSADVQGTPDGTIVPVPLWARLIVAAAIVIWGARTNRQWTVAVAATVALPVLWITGFAVLAGAVPELRAQGARSPLRRLRPSTPLLADALAGDAARLRDPGHPVQAGSVWPPPRRATASSGAPYHLPNAPDAKPSLTIVLPAYNESERIGPALDELFGYLERTGPAREGGRPATELGPWDVLVVDDGSTDDTAAIVEARPEAKPGPDGKPAHCASCAARTKARERPFGRASSTPPATWWPSRTRTWPRRPTSCRSSPPRSPITTSRSAAASSPTAATGAPASRSTGSSSAGSSACWPVPGSPVPFPTRSAASRASGARRDRTCSPASGSPASSSTRRSSTLPGAAATRIAIVPVQWSDKRGSRMRVRPGLALPGCMGSGADPADPPQGASRRCALHCKGRP